MVRDQLVGDISNTATMLVEDNADSTTMPVDDIARTHTMASSNNTTSHQSTEWTRLTSLDTHVDTGKVSSQTDIICVQGYNVKKIVAPILESIFNKHGDIADGCVFKPVSMRSSYFKIVCEVVGRIQTNNDIDNIEEIEQQLLATEAANINVSWLRTHLDVIRKRKEASTKCGLLMEMKVNTVLVKKAAQMDLRERCVELMAAQERFEEVGRFVRVFHLVENNLNDSILESKGNIDSLASQPVL
ncbi:putative phospholipase [Helianthus annuus]|nr:putative phospholipase [Helianthus annuus]